MQEDVSLDLEGKTYKSPKPLRNMETKEKKKKTKDKTRKQIVSKKRGHSTTPQNSDDSEKPQSAPPVLHEATPPSQIQPLSQGHRGQNTNAKLQGGGGGGGVVGGAGGGGGGGGEKVGKNKKSPKDSTAPPAGTCKKSAAVGPGASATQRGVVELSAQAKESLRWEGVLEDPLEEKKRLEEYKANRRLRYVAERQALTAQGQAAILGAHRERGTLPKQDL